ncbi:MAG: proline iminopeptidase [Gammaproteobacteria bacterium]|jgi:proline iminopeptidase
MLYPAIHATRHWKLPVSDLHTLYVEESGNPAGLPVVFLHGGPGGSCDTSHRRFFNPEKYRIILFDQRGCGRSRPHASIEENTTWDLVSDMEQIRTFLDIDRWVLFGGSWGSTLALAYAETHPDRVEAMILRGIFLARDEDVNWFFNGVVARMLPESWQRFIEPIPQGERGDMVSAYYKRLTSSNELVRMGAAKAWSIWEGTSVTLLPDRSVVDYFSDPHIALSIARLECHYFYHKSFMRSNQLLEDSGKISGIPGYIVHGRYDMVCPVDQAVLLNEHWSASTLKVIDDAGHAVTEPGIREALVKCTDDLIAQLI